MRESLSERMNLKSTPRFLTDGFLYILVFPLGNMRARRQNFVYERLVDAGIHFLITAIKKFSKIIRRTRGEDNRALDLQQYLINYYLLDGISDQYHPTTTETTTLDNYNSEYPYKELLNLVKETKRILQSPNPADEDRKKILENNFGTRYFAYLRGENSDKRCPHPSLNCPPIPAAGLVPPPPSPVLGPLPPRPPPPQEILPPYPSYKPELAHTPHSYAVPAVQSIPTSFLSPQTPLNAPGSYNKSVSPSVGSELPRLPVPNAVPVAADAGPTERPPCEQITHTYRPDRLKSIDGKEQFILNLGNEFVQEIQVVQCRNYETHCGDRSTWPETYEKLCVQSYNSYKVLFSVPVEKKISILDQKLRVFEVSSGCHCLLRKKSTMR